MYYFVLFRFKLTVGHRMFLYIIPNLVILLVVIPLFVCHYPYAVPVFWWIRLELFAAMNVNLGKLVVWI